MSLPDIACTPRPDLTEYFGKSRSLVERSLESIRMAPARLPNSDFRGISKKKNERYRSISESLTQKEIEALVVNHPGIAGDSTSADTQRGRGTIFANW
jgi:hypothetical protein